MYRGMYNGYIYILTNPSMKGLVKIGITTGDPKERADKLSEPTGVATKFVVAYQQFVSDCYQVEKSVHRRLKPYRRKKEFFRIDVNKAIDVVNQEAAHFLVSKEPVKPTEAIETKPYPPMEQSPDYDETIERTNHAQKHEHDTSPPYSPEKLPTKSPPIWTSKWFVNLMIVLLWVVAFFAYFLIKQWLMP